jgi:HSP20 family protein
MKLGSLMPLGQDRLTMPRLPGAFSSLHNEIDRLFEDFGQLPALRSNEALLVPKMDLSETNQAIEITVELPGLEEKDVNINFADDILTIRGEKKSEKEQSEKNFYIAERSYGAFSRAIRLPAGTDADSIRANIEKGVLTVTVPKPAAKVARKIDVKATA